MGKIKFFLKRPKSKHETKIFLLYYYNYDCFKYYTSETIHPDAWDKKTQRPKDSNKFPNNTNINRQLLGYELFLNDLLSDLKKKKIRPTNDILKASLDKEFKIIEEIAPEKKKNLLQYLKEFISDCEKGLRLTPHGTKYQGTTIKAYNVLQHHLTEYMNARHRKLDFKDITIDFYDDFVFYFHQNDYATNSIGNQIKNLKVIMKAALEDGIHSNMEFQRKKFRKISEECDSIYLNEEELEKIYKLDLSNNKKFERVRDLFIVAARTALRFSDLIKLKEVNFIENNRGYFLKIHTKKTMEEVIVPLKREVVEIFNKYERRFPRSISNQKMNDYLKQISQMAELKTKVTKVGTRGGLRFEEIYEKWQMVTTHTARRSAATNLFLAGFEPISIMKITGHRTERSFLKYIRMTKEDNAYKMAESDYFKNDFQSEVKLKIVS